MLDAKEIALLRSAGLVLNDTKAAAAKQRESVDYLKEISKKLDALEHPPELPAPVIHVSAPNVTVKAPEVKVTVPVEPRPTRWKFDLTRDTNGQLKEIIATAIPD